MGYRVGLRVPAAARAAVEDVVSTIGGNRAMNLHRVRLIELLNAHTHHSDTPIKLSSGGSSHHYVDARAMLGIGENLRTACRAVLSELTVDVERNFTVVGGATMGADPISHGMAAMWGYNWVSVRAQPKAHGLGKLVEGYPLQPGDRVLLVEDTATTGGSLLRAHDAIVETGAVILCAVVLLDRGRLAAAQFHARRVHYVAVATYADLGIPEVTDS